MKNYKIIHLVRKVSPTSMPWNDLFRIHRLLDRSSSGYVFSFNNDKKSGAYLDQNTNNKYFVLNLVDSLWILCKIALKNKRSKRVSIFHVHNMSLIPYIIFIKLLGGKSVLNVHNSLANFNFIQYSFFRLGWLFFDAIVSVSDSVGEEIVNKFPRAERKVYPIRNGINIQQLRQINNLDHYNSKNIDVIVVARFVEQKNVFKILSVLSKCKNLNKVVWYGVGKKMQMAKSFAEKGPLFKVLEFKGIKPRFEVLKAIDDSKVYLSLSKWEGIGVANIEALALPTEVILSDIPPSNELFANHNLTLIDLQTADVKIANFIDDKISHYEERESFLLNRSKVTRKKYDLRMLVGKYIKVYDGLVSD